MSELEFPIADDETHAAAIREMERLVSLDPQHDSLEEDQLVWLCERINEYARKRWPLPL